MQELLLKEEDVFVDGAEGDLHDYLVLVCEDIVNFQVRVLTLVEWFQLINAEQVATEELPEQHPSVDLLPILIDLY